ncbi:MAG: hypothetical protein JRH20_11590 [Deltaproteobacteria bacterium]|nr:hypothetical protein [Deltaproteobacteria bacterium]
MSWTEKGRNASLLFFASVGTYLLCVMISAALVPRVALWMRGSDSLALRILMGALTTDLSKLITLVPISLLLARRVPWSPMTTASALVGLTYTFDLALSALLLQRWLFEDPAVWATRGAIVALSIWICGRVIARWRRRHRPNEAPSNPERKEGDSPK